MSRCGSYTSQSCRYNNWPHMGEASVFLQRGIGGADGTDEECHLKFD